MGYPHNQLTDGETVLIEQHPHGKVLALPLLAATAIVAGCGYLAALAAGTPIRQLAWIALAVIAVAAVGWFGLAPWLRWKTTHFVVTTDKVMFREGVVSRTGMNIPASRIASVRVEIDLNDRLFGCGSLIIESQSAEPLRFTDIAAVEEVHNLLYQAVHGDTGHLSALQ